MSSSQAGSKTSHGDWVEYYDDVVGALFYYNQTTGEAAWVKPDTLNEEDNKLILNGTSGELASELESVPTIWTIHTASNGKQYYYSKSSGESKYDVPEVGMISISPAQLKSNEDLKTQLEACITDYNGRKPVTPVSPTGEAPSLKSSNGFRSNGKLKLIPIGGMRTRKKRRVVVKRTKSRRKFSNRTKSRRKFNNRTKNKK